MVGRQELAAEALTLQAVQQGREEQVVRSAVLEGVEQAVPREMAGRGAERCTSLAR